MSKTAEKATAGSLVTHREFKLLLEAREVSDAARRAGVQRLCFARVAKKLGVHYEPVESLDSQLRIVQFYDTKAEDLRKNKLIFRIRQIRESVWPGESWELTFKCRAPEYEKAAAFNTDTTLTKLQRKKFKEELIRGEEPGTMVRIFSNNVIVQYPDISVETEFPISRLADKLPHLRTLGLNPDDTIAVVAGAKVFELQSDLGNFSFGHGVTAHATLAAMGAAGARSFRAARRGVWILDARARQGRKGGEGAESCRRVLQGHAGAVARLPLGGYDEDGAHLRGRRCLSSSHDDGRE